MREGAAQQCVAADERRRENGRRSQLNAVLDAPMAGEEERTA